MSKSYRAGDSIEDVCRACKTDRLHTVVAADGNGRPIRVVCDYCDSEHNFRGGPRIDVGGTPSASGAAVPPSGERPVRSGGDSFALVSDRERVTHSMSIDSTHDLELLLRRVIREEAGVTAVTPADKWRGGTLVLRPGRPGVQEKAGQSRRSFTRW